MGRILKEYDLILGRIEHEKTVDPILLGQSPRIQPRHGFREIKKRTKRRKNRVVR